MDGRKLPWLVPAVFGIALVALVVDAGSGPGWGTASAHVVLAARFDHVAASPLYDLVAGAFTALVPAGEPGFRLGLLAALLGACTLAGVVAAARALLPKDPFAGVVGAVLLMLAPPFREAAAFASPAMLAAAGLTWSLVFALRFVTEKETRDAVTALAACALVIGSTPWLGALATIVVVGWLARAGARRDVLAIVVGALGLLMMALWLTASGSLPGLAASVGAPLVVAGRGSAAIVVGVGLIGLGFGALTSLPRVRPLALVMFVVLVHEVLVGGNAAVLLAVGAIGIAIVPSAVVRALSVSTDGLVRHALTLGAAVPVVGVAFATGATITVEDPADAPTTLAHDLVDSLPPGSGVFVATRPATWLAIHHEMVVAGVRPDLALVPPVRADQADVIVANALREKLVVGSDAASFGRLDVTRATPRGRAFQLLGDVPPAPARVLPPAEYATVIGREEAIALALERARYEALNGRLDGAARAAGLEQRFGAADLAVLGATIPTRDRPALFGMIPGELLPRGAAFVLDLFGDDLAWVAGIPVPALPAHAPAARRLHAKWRAILSGAATPNDPDIAALGASAVSATRTLFVEVKPPGESGAAAGPTTPTDAATD